MLKENNIMKKFRVIYLENVCSKIEKNVAEIICKNLYAVIGHGNVFRANELKKDWGKLAKWGKYIKLP